MKQDVLIYIGFAVISALILFPFLFEGELILSGDSDALYFYYAIFDFYGRALKSGDSFLWNPFIYSGFPTYLSQTGGFFDPVNLLLFRFFPSFLAYHLRLLLDLFLILLFSYLAGRALGLSRLASSLIGIGYILAFHWRFLSNILIANTPFLMPFLLWTFLRAFGGSGCSRLLWAVLGGVGLGWAFLSGYTQIVFYALFLFGLFGIYYAVAVYREGDLLGRILTLFLIFLTIGSVGIFIGLPQILPATAYIPFSTREGGLEFSETTAKSIAPGDGILFLLPDYLYFPYLSAGRKPLYIGAFWFLMALAGIILAKRRPIILGVALLFGVSLFTSLQGSPFFYVLQKLPIFEYFRFPFRWMYLGTFFLSVLGAYGFDSLCDFISSQVMRKTFLAAGLIILAIVLLVLFFNSLNDSSSLYVGDFLHSIFAKFLYGKFGFIKDPAHYRDAILRGIDGWREFISLKDVSFALPFALLISAAVLVGLLFLQKISWNFFRISGFLFSFLGFIGIFAVQWKNSVPLEIVQRHGELLRDIISPEDLLFYRVYPVFLDRAFQKAAPPQFKLSYDEQLTLTELQFAAGRPNMHMYSAISSVDGYDVFVPRELRDVLRRIGSLYGGEGGKEQNFFDYLDVIGMMSGKYIISGEKLDQPDMKFLASKDISERKIPLYVYQNKKALPKFYFAKEEIFTPHQNLSELLDSRKRNFSEVSYIDCGNCKGVVENGAADVKLISAKNGFYRLRTHTDSERWLIISESYLPGWTAKIDGSPREIIRANGFYMAVSVPAGEHEVVFEYQGILGEAGLLKKLGVIKDR